MYKLPKATLMRCATCGVAWLRTTPELAVGEERHAYGCPDERELAEMLAQGRCSNCALTRYEHTDHVHLMSEGGRVLCPFGDCGVFDG